MVKKNEYPGLSLSGQPTAGKEPEGFGVGLLYTKLKAYQ